MKLTRSRGRPRREYNGLDPQQERFVRAFLVCRSYTQAALAVGIPASRALFEGVALGAHRPIAQAILAGLKRNPEAAEAFADRMEPPQPPTEPPLTGLEARIADARQRLADAKPREIIIVRPRAEGATP